MPGMRRLLRVVIFIVLGAAAFVLLVVTLSERLVDCVCSDGSMLERWVTGWQRDDRAICMHACAGHGPGRRLER